MEKLVLIVLCTVMVGSAQTMENERQALFEQIRQAPPLRQAPPPVIQHHVVVVDPPAVPGPEQP